MQAGDHQVKAKSVWGKCCDLIAAHITQEEYQNLFEPLIAESFVDGKLILTLPSYYFYELLERRYVPVLRDALNRVVGEHATLEYSILVDPQQGVSQHHELSPSPARPAPQAAQPSKGIQSPFQNKAAQVPDFITDNQLQENYTFENFIEGECNRLARSAGLAVSQKPGLKNFNPLFLYGSVGLGKTHLVQAIGNRIKTVEPGRFVLYVSCEKFTDQFMEALRNNQVQNFTNYYNTVDVLIIDDVHHLSGKTQTQEIFFSIFNSLYLANKQIIMTSDRQPKEIATLTDRLESRMTWGLMADIQQPDYETKVAIIRQKMYKDGVEIPKEVVSFIAESVEKSIRELESVINGVIFEAFLDKTDVNIELAKRAMNRIFQRIESMDIDFIKEQVASYFKIPVEDLEGIGRKKEIVYARQIAMYMAKNFTKSSLKAIGKQFGDRDHTTVMHALDKVNKELESNEGLKKAIEEIKSRFKAEAAA